MQSIIFSSRLGPQVRKGIKLQSVRRSTPLKPGDLCDLREYSATGTTLLRAGVQVTAVQPIRIALDYPDSVLVNGQPVNSADQFAIADGFASLLDMLTWHHQEGYDLPFSGVLIEWEPLPACIQCGATDAPHTIRPNRHLYCSPCYQSAISLP